MIVVSDGPGLLNPISRYITSTNTFFLKNKDIGVQVPSGCLRAKSRNNFEIEIYKKLMKTLILHSVLHF